MQPSILGSLPVSSSFQTVAVQDETPGAGAGFLVGSARLPKCVVALDQHGCHDRENDRRARNHERGFSRLRPDQGPNGPLSGLLPPPLMNSFSSPAYRGRWNSPLEDGRITAGLASGSPGPRAPAPTQKTAREARITIHPGSVPVINSLGPRQREPRSSHTQITSFPLSALCITSRANLTQPFTSIKLRSFCPMRSSGLSSPNPFGDKKPSRSSP
jgi:hypothetical protein